MKNLSRLKYVLTILVLLTGPFKIFSQISISSSSGYAVNVIVIPTNVIPSSTSCQWGYNYNIKLNYTATFSGSSIPASLYTLQGYINCGSASHFFDLPNNGGVGTVTSTSNQWNGASDCNTATVSSLSCNTARIQIEGIGIASQTISFPITYVALPVNLTGFTVNTEGNKVKVKWETATESGNRYFAIKRSADGIAWHEMARINGAGNSSVMLSYQWYDEDPLPGMSYYRLEQIDLDGNTSLSAIRTVQINTGKNNITLYPVPNTGNTINISGVVDYTDLQLMLINDAGATIFNTLLRSPIVHLPDLKPGIYIASIVNKLTGATQNLRYIKL